MKATRSSERTGPDRTCNPEDSEQAGGELQSESKEVGQDSKTDKMAVASDLKQCDAQ